MLRWSVPLLILLTTTPAVAQGGPPLPTMPEIPRLPTELLPPPPDGKVIGLNSTTFAAIAEIRRRNPRGFSEADAAALRSAVKADGKLDPAETDLLREMLNSRVRAISIRRAGAPESEPATLAFPASGAAARLLSDVVDPPLDLAPLWAAGQPGWGALIAEARKGAKQEAQVTAFVTARVGDAWRQATVANAYKPARDLVGQLYRWSMTENGIDNVRAGRAILWIAYYSVDTGDQDRMPDFIYNWTKPSAPN